jgi:nucleoside-diphosphate-sugar epimerase
MENAAADSRIAITGAAGFVGSALVRHLHGSNARVLAVSRTPCAWPGNVQGITVAGYEDAQELARTLQGVDAVVHLAARAHRGGSHAEFSANVRCARAVAKASRDAGVRRLVLVSSIGANGDRTEGRLFTEADAPAPAEPYAFSKLQSENAVMEELAGGPTTWTILRPPLVYGPGAPGNFGKLVRAVDHGWIFPFGRIQNARSLLALGNLLRLVDLCIEQPAAANQLFLASDGEDVSTPALIRHIAQGLGKPAHLVDVPVSLLRTGAGLLGQRKLAQSLCGSLQVDSSKARRMLGWVPHLRASEAIAQAVREGAKPC